MTLKILERRKRNAMMTTPTVIRLCPPKTLPYIYSMKEGRFKCEIPVPTSLYEYQGLKMFVDLMMDCIEKMTPPEDDYQI